MKRKTWMLGAATILLVAAVVGGVASAYGAKQATVAEQEPSTNTAKVKKGTLTAMISMYGTLTYRAQPDGSPYPVINRARGTFTQLPVEGDQVDCGDVFYRVDDKPVLLLCGTVPAYRDLRSGATGNDVRQLNQNLHDLGYGVAAGAAFTSKTQQALKALQHDRGAAVTGELAIDDAIFLPDSARIAKVTGAVGAAAQPGAEVAQATSDTLEVRVALDPSQQAEVHQGVQARITLPGQTSVTGTVDRLGKVAQVPDGQNQDTGAPTIPAYIRLDDPAKASGLDRAAVQVEITTTAVENALSVPVTAIVGKSGGGFAVEVVRGDGRRELVAVKLGLYDTAGGRVQVEGDLGEGDDVVVPAL